MKLEFEWEVSMKGLSFNVALSEEQMEHIAALSADKIDYTFRRLKQNDVWYEDKIKQLEYQVKQRDELIVGKELQLNSLRKILEMYKEKLKKIE